MFAKLMTRSKFSSFGNSYAFKGCDKYPFSRRITYIENFPNVLVGLQKFWAKLLVGMLCSYASIVSCL